MFKIIALVAATTYAAEAATTGESENACFLRTNRIAGKDEKGIEANFVAGDKEPYSPQKVSPPQLLLSLSLDSPLSPMIPHDSPLLVTVRPCVITFARVLQRPHPRAHVLNMYPFMCVMCTTCGELRYHSPG